MSRDHNLPRPVRRTARLTGLALALLVVLGGLVGLAPSPSATAVAGATVTGRFVTQDGAPIDAIRAMVFANNTLVAEATSGADGTFTVTGVPAGSYTLFGSDLFDTYASGSGTPLTVVDGQTKALGDLELYVDGWTSPNTRLTGIVRDPAGNPVRGIQVLARTTTPLQADSQVGGFAVTDRAGRYNIDNDGGSNPPVPGTYKLHFSDRGVVPETFGWGGRYSGDQPTWARATTVTIDGTLRTVPDVTVSRNGGISGTLTGTVPMTNGTVTVYDIDGDQVTSKATGAGGTYAITTLRPGGYYLRFSSADTVPGGGAKFVRTFWPGAASIIGATPVTVTTGAFTTGIDQTLSDQLLAFRAPTIAGRPVVGATLTASPGSWSLSTGTEYAYEWLRGAVVVATTQTYRPVAADAGQPLRVRVTARSLDRSGTALSASTAPVRRTSTVSAQAAYKRAKKQLVLTLRVVVPGLANPGGTVSVKEGSRTIKAGVAVRNGSAVVKVPRPRKGAHTYLLAYAGTATVLPATGSVRVRVPR